MFKFATLLLASVVAIDESKKDQDDHENQLAQSFATAMNMEPPKLMSTDGMTQGGKDACPTGGVKLTSEGTKGAFLDGCYMNTTREQARNEQTGEEAQNYLYMWKHACAFTKWVPSNQFMYSGLDYNPSEMTLERFGFIGMDKRCFWGSIGVLWKRPLPVEQILPMNNSGPGISYRVAKGNLYNKKSTDNVCLVPKTNEVGSELWLDTCRDDGPTTWIFYQNSTLEHVESGLCLTIRGNQDLEKMYMSKCDPAGRDYHQKWQQRMTSQGYFQIQNYQYTEVCLDLPKKQVANQYFTARNWKCIKEGEEDNMQYKWVYLD